MKKEEISDINGRGIPAHNIPVDVHIGFMHDMNCAAKGSACKT